MRTATLLVLSCHSSFYKVLISPSANRHLNQSMTNPKKMTCAPSKASDQPEHPPSLISLSCALGGYQDQDSLLVKRRNYNHSPEPVIRELVPSSHQRSELSNTILCIFSGLDQRIGEGIPIPDSLGEETTFINSCISNGSLKCHRVLISTVPSFGDKVICWL